MLNALGRQALENIRQDLIGWDQQHYYKKSTFGTTLCFAGHVLKCAGFVPSANRYGQVVWHNAAGQRVGHYGAEQEEMTFYKAMYLLEWSYSQADEVFYATQYSADNVGPGCMFTSYADMYEKFSCFVHKVAEWGGGL